MTFDGVLHSQPTEERRIRVSNSKPTRAIHDCNIKRNYKYSVVVVVMKVSSLFTGAGGLDLGLELVCCRSEWDDTRLGNRFEV